MAKNNKAIHDGYAITGFVLSLVGLWVFPIVCGVLSIIFGSVSADRAKKAKRKPSGLAKAGLIIGIIDLAFGLIMVMCGVTALVQLF